MTGFEPPPFLLEAMEAAARPTGFERLCADMGIHPKESQPDRSDVRAYEWTVSGTVRDLLQRQTQLVEQRLRGILAARGVDPDDRSDGWEDRARAVLGDLEVVEGPIVWTGDWSARIDTTIRPRQS